MSLEDLLGEPEPSPSKAEPRGRRRVPALLRSAEVAPVAAVSFVGMCLPVLALYGRIPILTASDPVWFIGWAVSWAGIVVAWLVGLTGSIAGFAASVASRRLGWTAVIVAITVGLGGVAVAQHADSTLSAAAYQRVHRDDFDAIMKFAQSGALAGNPDDDPDGVLLPAPLRGYAANDRIFPLGSKGPTQAFFVPVARGWTGGAIGFAYAAHGEPVADEDRADLQPGYLEVVADLGHGWWWMETPRQ